MGKKVRSNIGIGGRHSRSTSNPSQGQDDTDRGFFNWFRQEGSLVPELGVSPFFREKFRVTYHCREGRMKDRTFYLSFDHPHHGRRMMWVKEWFRWGCCDEHHSNLGTLRLRHFGFVNKNGENYLLGKESYGPDGETRSTDYPFRFVKLVDWVSWNTGLNYHDSLELFHEFSDIIPSDMSSLEDLFSDEHIEKTSRFSEKWDGRVNPD